MSQLTLTKKYGDLTLLFAADIHDMWDELEAKINGNLDADNVQDGFATWGQVVLEKDVNYDLGSGQTFVLRYYEDTDTFVMAHDTTARNTIFKIGGTEVARVDTSANFISKQDIYFFNRSTTYPLSYLIGYRKPVLVYVDGTTINVEQNVAIANRSLVVFPSGPVAVTEDVSVTHKFRQLRTGSTANGYATAHTGAADSGMRSGVSLTANTWYFVYAVIVRGGDDAGNNFILVGDTAGPNPENWSAHDTNYGSGNWVYLGAFRWGFGLTATTTMVPFIYDHSGWLSFTGRAAANEFFGVKKSSQSVTSTSYTTLYAVNDVPTNFSLVKVTIKPYEGDSDMQGQLVVTDTDSNTLFNLPSFGSNLSSGEAHGWEVKVPGLNKVIIKGKRGNTSSEDFDVITYLAALLDEYV